MAMRRRFFINKDSNYATKYFTIEALEDGLTVKLSRNTSYYSIDNGVSWNSLSANTATPSINTGQKILFKLSSPTISSSYGIGTFTISKRHNISGNIMSLLYGDDFIGQLSLSGKTYTFYNLLYNDTNLVDASNLILPATTLADYCYYRMFYGCSSLTTAPELPATTLAHSCYYYMFYNCTSLVSAPELPATTLASYCYSYMFNGCSSLTTAPELPATTLAIYCYQNMFSGCSSLTTAPELPATTLASYCYNSMFSNCNSLTTASELPATTLANYCYNDMFYGCNSLTTAPELPATTLADYCYYRMFYGCSSLTTAPELPATTLANSCYSGMFQNCTNLTTVPEELPATTLADSYYSCYSGMFQNCTSLTTAPELPATTLAENCYRNMFYGCTSLVSTPELPATTLASYCYYGMFQNCTNLTTAVELPATTLANYCYNYMFFGCTSLTTAPELHATTFASYCCSYMFNGCTSLTTAPELHATTLAYSCCNDMFNGCTSLTTAPELPATTLTYECYYRMFSGCSSLTTAPELPATTLATACYQNMFSGCSSLTTAPELPATTLAIYCYQNMFSGCSSLTTAPELPATTLANYCYNNMFYGCSSLTTAPELPATTLAYSCYKYMFQNCTNLTTAPAELPATTLTEYCYDCMFYGCTSLTTAPELPATTLANYCYNNMFYGCSSLTTAPELPATTLATACYQNMFSGCSSLTTAPGLRATKLMDHCYYYMFYNCSKLNYIKMLATDISATNCLYNWVYGVASNGVFIKHYNMKSLTTGANGIPSGWTVEDNITLQDCISLEITADDAYGNQITTNIYYTAKYNAIDDIGNIIVIEKTGTAVSEEFPQNTSETEIIERTISFTFEGLTATTTIMHGDAFFNSQYFAIEALENGLTVKLSRNKSYYSINNGNNWYSLSANTATPSINTGQKILFKLSNPTISSSYGIGTFTISKRHNISGNIMSLLYGDNFANQLSLSGKSYAFYKLLSSDTNLVDASKLILRATTLANYCYCAMFQNCTNLTTAPKLPATTLVDYCYYYMFYGCSSLTTAPKLPATTLANYCYYYMFYNCSKLNYIKMLATNIKATNCLYNWVYGVAYRGTFIKHRDMNSLTTGSSGIPSGWIVEDNNNITLLDCIGLEITADDVGGSQTTSTIYYTAKYKAIDDDGNITVIEKTGTAVSEEFPQNTSETETIERTISFTFEGFTATTTIMHGDAIFNSKYFTIEALEDGLTVKLSSNTSYYSIDNGNSWYSLSTNTATPSINTGQKILFKLSNPTISSSYGIGTFTISKRHNISGNIMSLLYGDNFANQLSLSGKTYAFYYLFNNDTNLVDASHLILPATTLADYCYGFMFYKCSSLVSIPKLPATKLTSYCYNGMFYECTGLTTVPKLPATKLATYCYYYMFHGCSSLTTAPELPATTLTDYCYSHMFHGCSSLTTAPELPATTLANYCYNTMFQNCTNLTTAPELPATTLASDCYYGMFNGCTSLTTAPELPATTLASYCYYEMFYRCTSLTSAPELPVTTLANGCYRGMFSGCTSLTSAPELPVTTLTDRCYYSMFSGCTNLISAPELPATTLTDDCYSHMFSGCRSLTTAPELPATTLANNCYYGMFNGCTSLTTAPELPATTLADYCYQNMFFGCTSLTTAPELPATTLANYCYYYMFNGCSSLTIVPKKLPATTLANYCYYYMFYGCSSLITAPELPATTLANYCYCYMFYNCSKLNYIKMLATDISAANCLSNWVYWVASKGTFIKHYNMKSLTTGANGIPNGWTVKDNITLQDCISLEITAEDVGGSQTTTTIYYTAKYNAIDENGNTIVAEKTGTAVSEEFPQNTSETEIIERTISFAFEGFTATTTIMHGDAIFNSKYFTIEALEDGLTVQLSQNSSYYSIDNGNSWNSLSANTATPSINIGKKILFKLSNPTISSSYGIGTFTISKRHNISGNIMSLLYGDDFVGQLSLSGKSYAFYSLLYSDTKLVDASHLILPATTLADYCYGFMFQNCTNLTTAPKLPATTLADSCYEKMFYGCNSLTTTLELLSTNLTNRCYYAMFYGCSSLTTAPELPATTLADSCYSAMFQNCTNLTTAPELPATTLAFNCYASMFTNCGKITDAPVLPANILTRSCYGYMFKDCSKLNYIKMLATDISATDCLVGWVDGVASSGTFIKHYNMKSLTTGKNGIPSGWIVEDDITLLDCISLEISADDVSGRKTSTTIYYTAKYNAIDGNGNTMIVEKTGTATSEEFPQNTSETETIERTISFTFGGITATTTITQGVWKNQYYTIDLNNNWQVSSKPNPNSSLYDGVYESFSNKGKDSTAAIMYIDIVGYTNFKLHIRSYAESNYDYIMVSQLDQSINNSTSYSNTTLVKAYTRGKQTSGTALSNYELVEFTNIDEGEHRITIVYRKDGSAASGDDKGYIFIEK